MEVASIPVRWRMTEWECQYPGTRPSVSSCAAPIGSAVEFEDVVERTFLASSVRPPNPAGCIQSIHAEMRDENVLEKLGCQQDWVGE